MLLYMQDSEDVKDILSKLTSLDKALATSPLWALRPSEAKAIVQSRRLDILDIRKYLSIHKLVVLRLEERLIEANAREDRLRRSIFTSAPTTVNAQETYEKQIDNLTF
jgi:hypothetical protein